MLELAFPSRPLLCATHNPESQRAIESAMSGFRPVFCASACDAIRATNTGVYDAFLIEYWLADWSGPQLCRHIRETDPHTPIIIFNAADQGADRQRALRAGATACFVKPFDVEAVRTSLNTFLNLRDQQSLRARVEEERAVHEELVRQSAAIVDRTLNARHLAMSANERIARTKAYKAFTAAGGMRSHFDRWWPQVYEAVGEQRSPPPRSEASAH